jgi:hypothetical protein
VTLAELAPVDAAREAAVTALNEATTDLEHARRELVEARLRVSEMEQAQQDWAAYELTRRYDPDADPPGEEPSLSTLTSAMQVAEEVAATVAKLEAVLPRLQAAVAARRTESEIQQSRIARAETDRIKGQILKAIRKTAPLWHELVDVGLNANLAAPSATVTGDAVAAALLPMIALLDGVPDAGWRDWTDLI